MEEKFESIEPTPTIETFEETVQSGAAVMRQDKVGDTLRIAQIVRRPLRKRPTAAREGGGLGASKWPYAHILGQ